MAEVSRSRRTQAPAAIGLAKTSENSRGLPSAHLRKATEAHKSCAAGSSSGCVAAAARKPSVAALSISKATRSTSSW